MTPEELIRLVAVAQAKGIHRSDAIVEVVITAVRRETGEWPKRQAANG